VEEDFVARAREIAEVKDMEPKLFRSNRKAKDTIIQLSHIKV
jgi:hypothetical protein